MMLAGVVLGAVTFIPGKAYAWPVIRHVYISSRFLFGKANPNYFSIIAAKRNKLTELADKFQALDRTPGGYQKLFL